MMGGEALARRRKLLTQSSTLTDWRTISSCPIVSIQLISLSLSIFIVSIEGGRVVDGWVWREGRDGGTSVSSELSEGRV